MRVNLLEAAGVPVKDLVVYSVPPGEATEEMWQVLEPSLEYSLGDFELGDLMRDHAKGIVQMFVCEDGGVVEAVGITTFYQQPRRKVLLILAMAGKVKKFAVTFFPVFEYWGEMNGADVIEALCREYMVRYGEHYGFKEVQRIIRKPIERRNLQ